MRARAPGLYLPHGYLRWRGLRIVAVAAHAAIARPSAGIARIRAMSVADA